MHYRINDIWRLCRVSNPPVRYSENHKFRSPPGYWLFSLRTSVVLLRTEVRFFSWRVQPYTVSVEHQVVAVVLLETFWTSTFLLSGRWSDVRKVTDSTVMRKEKRLFGNGRECESPISIATTEVSNTCHCATHTSMCGKTVLKDSVTSVE
jgi:hypothetical protein